MVEISRPSSGPGSSESISRFQSPSGGSGDSSSGGSSADSEPRNLALESEALKPEFRQEAPTSNIVSSSSSGFVATSVLRGQATPTDVKVAESQARIAGRVVRAETPKVPTPTVPRSGGGGLIPQSFAVRESIRIAEEAKKPARIPERGTVVIREEERGGVTYKLPKPLVLTEKQAEERKKKKRKERLQAEFTSLTQAGGTALSVIPVPIGFLGKTPKAVKAGKALLPSIVQKGTTAKQFVVSKLPASKQAVAGALGKVKGVPGGQFVVSTTKGVATAVTVEEGIRKGSRLFTPAEQQEIMREPGFKQAVGAGFEAASKQAYGQAWYKGLATEISPFFGSEQAFEKAVTAEFRAQGFTGKELEKRVAAAAGERAAAGIAEAGGVLSISQQSEKVGRKAVTQAFEKLEEKGFQTTKKRIAGLLFKTTAPQIAKAGVMEGIGAELSQELARSQTVSGTQLALMGIFGGASAGIIGGGIAATRVTRPAISKTIELGAFVTDPFEKPGDVLQDISEGIFKRTSGITPDQPVIREVFKPEDAISLGVKSGKPPIPQKPGKVPMFSFGTTGTPTGVPVGVPTAVIPQGKEGVSVFEGPTVVPPTFTPPKGVIDITPLPPPSGRGRGGGGRGTMPTLPSVVSPPVPVSPKMPVIVPTIVPVQPLPITPRMPGLVPGVSVPPGVPPVPTMPVSVPPNIPENVLVPPEVPVTPLVPLNVPTNIPAFTPLMRVPPPILPQWPGAGRGAGVGKGKRLKFVRELELSQNLLVSLVDAPVRKREIMDAPKLAGFALGPGLGGAKAKGVKNAKGKKKKKKSLFPSIFG